ncbi:MAG TPA: hypothetical protein VGV18_11290 [Verrucomicrobiae bacterium]|nr:hypothetical protein [Verrucomicrobiae bacterium]
MMVYRLFHPASRQEVIERIFKDQEIFNVMTNSPLVTAQRLHRKSDGYPGLLNGYIQDAPVTLTADQGQQIENLLQSPSSYLWDVTSCLPDYGVVYNFQSGGHAVHVAFCFKCNILGVFDDDKDASNSINLTSQFDPMRGQMVALSKALFPADTEIQQMQ